MITDNFTELADRLRARHPLVGQLALRLGDARVVLASDSRALLAELFGYFRPFLDPHDPSAPAAAGDLELLALESPPMALSPELERQLVIRPPEPGKDSIKESSLELSGGRLIRKLRTGLTFLISDAVHLAIGPCCKNPNQIVNFVNNRLIERRLQQGWSLCHAAGVSRRGRTSRPPTALAASSSPPSSSACSCSPGASAAAPPRSAPRPYTSAATCSPPS
jgi:HprK-related kinase B